MQIILSGASDARVVASQASLLCLPELLKLTGVSPQTQALREELASRQRDKDRQRDELAAGAVSPGRAASPDLKPASAASTDRQQMLTQAQTKDAQQRSAFQRALSETRTYNPTSTPDRGGTPSNASSASPRNLPAATDHGTPPSPSGGADKAAAQSPGTQPTAANAAHPQNLSRAVGLQPSAAADARAVALRTPAIVSVASTAGGAAAKTAGVGNGCQSAQIKPAVAGPASAAAARAGGTASAVSRGGGVAQSQSGKTDTNVERILRVVRSQIGREYARATLRLDPPQLGTIRLRMDLQQDVLRLRIDTQTELAHRLLSEQLESLRQGLAGMGIHLEQVEIRPPAANAEANPSDQPPQADQRQEGAQHSATADTERSPDRGTDSFPAEPTEGAAGDATLEPAAESLVDLWA